MVQTGAEMLTQPQGCDEEVQNCTLGSLPQVQRCTLRRLDAKRFPISKVGQAHALDSANCLSLHFLCNICCILHATIGLASPKWESFRRFSLS